MKSQSGLDSFWPYDSIDELYCEKILPEFGLVPSKWQFTLPSWRFFHAENRDMVPVDFTEPSCNDNLWDTVDLPSVWQQEGYGIPSNLQYDAGSKDEAGNLRKRIQAKFAALSGSETDDDVGVYRTWITIPQPFFERAVYFQCSGIRGRFELYLNGKLITSSGACYSAQKILLSPFFNGENNLLTILVYRLDSDRHGRVRRENGTFGYSGIFRMPEIIAESFVELSMVQLHTSWIDSDPHQDINPLPAQTETDIIDDVHTNDEQELLRRDPGDRRDANIRMQVTLKSHSDLMIPIRVECELVEARLEYDLYHLPVHPVSVLQEMSGTVEGGRDLILNTELIARRVLPWSDQTPGLYDIVLSVKDLHDRVICVKKMRFGFRTTDVIARVFHINDAALPLRAVRYFSFDPVDGLAVSAERFRQDIWLIRQANLNTVLVAHLPADPVFYRMCDQYGLYVISQADTAHIFPMLESLMSHPCIAFWSFAPLHFDEAKFWEVKQKLLLLDGTRPFYCEKDKALTLSDIPPFPCEAGTLFGEWSDISIDKRVLQSKTEPGHSLFETMQGRAKRDSDTADFHWIHQGDLEEYHEKMDVPIAQGVVGADRIPHPIYFEIKKQCETLQIVASADSPCDLILDNLHPIGQTHDLILYWQLLMGGFRIRGGKGLIASIPPLGRQEIRFPFTIHDYLTADLLFQDPAFAQLYDITENHELVLDISVCLAESTYYADRGHEIAFYQQVLVDDIAGPGEKGSVPSGLDNLPAVPAPTELAAAAGKNGQGKLAVNTRPDALMVSNSSMQASFSRNSGGLYSVRFGGMEWLAGSLTPSFYRAATNSDRSDQSFVLAATVFSKETDWRTIQHNLQYERFHYEMEGPDFSLISHYKSFAFKGEVLVQYVMGKDGKLTVTLACTPRYDLLRSGFRVNIPQIMNRLSWYGRGFHEAYPDRKESARIGYYEASPEQLYHNYARPQENGNHCDTQYLIISDGSGKGIMITSGDKEKFSFSAALFAPEDIDDFQHQEEMPLMDTYELFLDFYQKDIERTGRENQRFLKNQTYRGTFIFEPWEAPKSVPSDHESP